MVKKLRLSVIWLALAIVTLALTLVIQRQWSNGIEQAKSHFIDSGHAATASQISKLDTAVRSIYENLRTLSSLPGIRDIDRHATNMSGEAHITAQQIYNNLASNVDVSEVYIVPIDFNPNRIDPVTLKSEEPILMYDELILNAGNGMTSINRIASSKNLNTTANFRPPEVESFEYAQLMDHAAWLMKHYPKLADVVGLAVPFISGPEVITCDNRNFISTGRDADRSGIMFSVPFYNRNGQIKGMISAVILTSALRDLLPLKNMALVNPGNNYASLAEGAQQMVSSRSLLESGKPDPKLIYSEVMPLSVVDVRSPWLVWSSLPNEQFWQSKDVAFVDRNRLSNFSALVAFALVSALIAFLTDRYLRQAATLSTNNLQLRVMAERSEAEAIENAEALQALNRHVSQLNVELSTKIRELTNAQEDIVAKGKMAQLGNLVATVAHELRNPLGGVRTTAFMLRRKLAKSAVDVTEQLERIDKGIARCDGIISQLLDFARTQPLSRSEVELEAWLLDLVNQVAKEIPPQIAIKLVLETENLHAAVDTERLRRGVINLVNNATEALAGKGNQPIREGAEIEISLKETARGVEVSVADNGPGIPKDIIDKIGEALFTTKSFGTGLGIAAVRKVAELHEGGLDVKSEFGQGARFTLWLPVKRTTLKAA